MSSRHSGINQEDSVISVPFTEFTVLIHGKPLFVKKSLKFEKNKIFYYQTLKQNLKEIMELGKIPLTTYFKEEGQSAEKMVEKMAALIPVYARMMKDSGCMNGKTSVLQEAKKVSEDCKQYHNLPELVNNLLT